MLWCIWMHHIRIPVLIMSIEDVSMAWQKERNHKDIIIFYSVSFQIKNKKEASLIKNAYLPLPTSYTLENLHHLILAIKS